MEFLGSMARQFIFFSGDVQTTTIAMAITGSLCCSVLAAIVQLIVSLHSYPVSAESQSCGKGASSQAEDSTDREYPESSLTNFQRLRQLLEGDFQSCIYGIYQRCKREGVEKIHSCTLLVCEEYSDTSSASPGQTYDIPCPSVVSTTVSGPSLQLQANADVDIDLSFQNIHQCPRRLGYSGSHLRSLNLSNNHLKELPEEIGCLTGLQELHLKNNNLSTLPPSLVSLKYLRELDLLGNCLKTLPVCVCSLSSLKHLNVSSNRLKTLPHKIASLKSLRVLSAGFNALENLPNELCFLKNLQALDCSNNKLSCLPETMGELVRLTSLDLTSCRLTSLPASLTRCAALTSLKLANNRLTSLPAQIGRVHRLRELEVYSNQLRVFPISLSGLPLQKLKVHDNPSSNTATDLADLSVTPPVPFPPLLEITARFIAQRKLKWRVTVLPSGLSDLLENCVECSTCEGPCFMYYSSKVTLTPVGHHQQWLPLLERSCSPHSAIGCKFRT